MDTTFAGINRSFCRNASGAILVGSLTDPNSIESTAEWKQQVEEVVAVNDSKIPMILALNKYDLIEEKSATGSPSKTTKCKRIWKLLRRKLGLLALYGAVPKQTQTWLNSFLSLLDKC